MYPISAPNARPINRTSGITISGVQPSRSKNAENTHVNAMVDAMEMSMPPVSNTNVTPMEAIIRYALSLNN